MLITPVATIIGLLIGSFSTYITQSKIKEKELKREQEKDKQIAITGCLEVYNEILKLDGEINLISNYGEENYIFQIGTYNEKLRPILYSKFHLLHKNVAEKVRSLDKIKKDEHRIENKEDKALILYRELILSIEKNIDSLRESYIGNTN